VIGTGSPGSSPGRATELANSILFFRPYRPQPETSVNKFQTARVAKLRCVNPVVTTRQDEDEQAPLCTCGDQCVWFTDPSGIESPELYCPSCVAFEPVR